MDLPIKIVIGGLGGRGYEVYASYAKRNPDKMQVTAIAEPNPIRRRDVQRDLGLSASAGQARRDIDGGGVKINGKAVAPKSYNIDPSALKLGDTLSVGKRKGFKLV